MKVLEEFNGLKLSEVKINLADIPCGLNDKNLSNNGQHSNKCEDSEKRGIYN